MVSVEKVAAPFRPGQAPGPDLGPGLGLGLGAEDAVAVMRPLLLPLCASRGAIRAARSFV
jgi:hypothetical protein